MAKKQPTTIDVATEDLNDATKAFLACKAEASNARKNETAALNRLNEKQKKFDEVVAAIKKDSPQQSDWNQKNGMES